MDPVINGFSPNEVKIHFHICDHSIVTFGIRELCLVFSNTSHIETLDRFRKPVVDKAKTDLCKKMNSPNKNNSKIKYTNEFGKIWVWVILKHVFINSFTMKMTTMTR